jgi:hypothetical protein
MEYYAPIEDQFLSIKGKVSQSSFDLIKSGLPTDKPNNTEILFVSYAFADVPVGKRFSVIFPKNKPSEGIYYESKIAAVTQQFGKPTELIPHGWKTICLVEFPRGIPEIIKNLPVVDTWFENNDYVCICEEEVWEAIKKL